MLCYMTPSPCTVGRLIHHMSTFQAAEGLLYHTMHFPCSLPCGEHFPLLHGVLGVPLLLWSPLTMGSFSFMGYTPLLWVRSGSGSWRRSLGTLAIAAGKQRNWSLRDAVYFSVAHKLTKLIQGCSNGIDAFCKLLYCFTYTASCKPTEG